jgi:hypothetical protein
LEESKIDFTVDGRSMNVQGRTYEDTRQNELLLCPSNHQVAEFLPMDGLPIWRHAVISLAGRVKPAIPAKFLDNLVEEHNDLAVGLLNNLKNRTPKRFFVRCLQDKVRAILSDSYRVIDNLDIAFGALKAVREAGGEVLYASLSESHMRISFTNKDLVDYFIHEEKKGGKGRHEFIQAADIQLPGDDGGDTKVHPVVTVSNSETGQGGTAVWYGVLRARCVNTALMEESVRHVHLGNRMDEGIFSAETQQKRADATMAELRDAIHAGLNQEVFGRLVNTVRQSAEVAITSPTAAVSNLVKATDLAESERDAILEHFLSDYDKNAYGLGQAVSRRAQDMEDPERANDYQRLAGRLFAGEFNQLVSA